MFSDEIYQLTRHNKRGMETLFILYDKLDNAPIFAYDTEYCFAERLPQLISLSDETT